MVCLHRNQGSLQLERVQNRFFDRVGVVAAALAVPLESQLFVQGASGVIRFADFEEDALYSLRPRCCRKRPQQYRSDSFPGFTFFDDDVLKFAFISDDARHNESAEFALESLCNERNPWWSILPPDCLVGFLGPVRSRGCGLFEAHDFGDVPRRSSTNP